MQSPRWPFVAALVAVVYGAGFAHAAPAVDEAAESGHRSISDALTEYAANRVHQREQPAADLLAQMPVPPGVVACNRAQNVAKTHIFCWRGSADIIATATAVADGLRLIGASAVTPRCGELRSSTRRLLLCEVQATLVGQPFRASLGPDIDPATGEYSGVSATGGVGVVAGLMLPLPRRAVPVPVPAVAGAGVASAT